MRVALLLHALHADFLLLLLLQQIKDHTGTPVAAAAIVSRGASDDVAQNVRNDIFFGLQDCYKL